MTRKAGPQAAKDPWIHGGRGWWPAAVTVSRGRGRIAHSGYYHQLPPAGPSQPGCRGAQTRRRGDGGRGRGGGAQRARGGVRLALQMPVSTSMRTVPKYYKYMRNISSLDNDKLD